MSRALVLVVLLLAAVGAAWASASPLPALPGCVPGARPTVRPRTITIACADANFAFTHLRWQSWTATGAHGVGTATVNDCTPNCAAGKFHSYPGSVRLSHAIRCPSGRRELTHLAWTLIRAPKGGVPAKGATTFRCT